MEQSSEKIRNRIVQHNLTINRIPLNTKNRFHEIASNDDFCNDYGMTLKYLIDIYDGILMQSHAVFVEKIADIDERISCIEGDLLNKKKEVKKKKRTLSGKDIGEQND